MKFSFTLSQSSLKVFSAFSTDLAAGLFLGLFTIHDFAILFTDLIFAIVFVLLAVKIEKILNEL